MYKCYCDICGEELTSFDTIDRYKLKKEWSSWGERGWERLDVHHECWEELSSIIREKREHNE